ncbi:hypothetical protein BJ165DRAFT_1398810 [Panaeolus papilionaceus]|nr:hypothetical protein BJ165DRAFT_1398810 [Panaeolus papilionaceus]
MTNLRALPLPNRLSVLQFIAYTSFASYIISQAHLLAHPKYSTGPIPYSPSNAFIFAFFAFSAVLNASWLRQCCTVKWNNSYHQASALFVPIYRDMESSALSQGEKSSLRAHIHSEFDYYDALSTQSDCLPYYIVGQILLMAWTVTCYFEQYEAALFVILAQAFVQFYLAFYVLDCDIHPITPFNQMSHTVMKVNAGLSVLYVWQNWSILDNLLVPPIAELLNTVVFFMLLTVASGPDPTLGICLLYDLVALVYGRTHSMLWYRTFLCSIVAVATILLVDLHIALKDGHPWLNSEQDEEEDSDAKKPLHAFHKHELGWDILISSLVD